MLAKLRQSLPLVQQPPAASATAAGPQSQPASASQSRQEPRSLLILGSANYGAPGQRGAFGNNRLGAAPTGIGGRSLFAITPEAERAMEQALVSREIYTDLSLEPEMNYFQANRAEYFVPVTLKIPGSQLAGSEKAKHIALDIIGEVTDSYGTHLSNVRDNVDIQLSDETARELPSRQVAFNMVFTLLTGPYSVKFLVHDRITDRMGTYRMDFVIPNLNKETNLPVSSVVLSNELISLGDALSGPVQPSPDDPLVFDGKELVPSAIRTYSKRRDLIVFLQAYEPNAATTEALTAFVTFYQGQTKVFETRPLTVKDELGRRIKTVPVQLHVPLTTLPVGSYDLQVTVQNPATQKSAISRIPITVVN
jgi:hypothetical protein